MIIDTVVAFPYIFGFIKWLLNWGAHGFSKKFSNNTVVRGVGVSLAHCM
jgi:hypothetical protein